MRRNLPPTPCSLGDPSIVRINVAHARLGQQFIAALHFLHDPPKPRLADLASVITGRSKCGIPS